MKKIILTTINNGIESEETIELTSAKYSQWLLNLEKHNELYQKYGREIYIEFSIIMAKTECFETLTKEIMRTVYDRYNNVPSFWDIIAMTEPEFSALYEDCDNWFTKE